ncbi:RNA polymerase sigma factor [Singulisphaera sp. PoT]|uniref:RNA polymerase sigma factor n=1 Tax=Singulisphaera sp. PoT TaxID=3411797 RepID=UPI003BF504AE
MGDKPNLGAELGRFREYLSLLARLEVSPRLRSAIDLSGVVQQTLLEAFRSGPQGRTSAQTAAWLRAILVNNLADEARRLGARKRDIFRERSLDAALDRSASRLEGWLKADQSSPSQRAIRHEEFLELVQALAELPESQRQAVELHHLKGLSLAEIAEELGVTKPAVAGLLHRGLKALRAKLAVGMEG